MIVGQISSDIMIQLFLISQGTPLLLQPSQLALPTAHISAVGCHDLLFHQLVGIQVDMWHLRGLMTTVLEITS